jgi:hypothetical protein
VAVVHEEAVDLAARVHPHDLPRLVQRQPVACEPRLEEPLQARLLHLEALPFELLLDFPQRGREAGDMPQHAEGTAFAVVDRARDLCRPLDQQDGVGHPLESLFGGAELVPEERLFHERTEDAVFRLVDRVDGRGRDPGLRSDLGDRHGVDALSPEQRPGSGQDPLPRLLGGLGAGPGVVGTFCGP